MNESTASGGSSRPPAHSTPEALGAGSIIVDPAHPSGPAEQVRSQLAALIHGGVLQANAKLPTVRQLAGDLRLAAGTVAKAYRELEAAGLVRTGRAAGTRVNPGRGLAEPALIEAQDFARAAKAAGLNLEQAQGLLAVGWDRTGT
ncbi:GntR family transcriptional regulator [Paeniglutamicibacter psychrophenolicus]|uniref:GntR family transcriptional regulator n=1 Tax=Paeniglutamicibacter psychrophenolicus TaxID=257454 RepID=UPI00278819BF|nr:GntR family transcriptional regulator [Paeniglutamicibacter psychrophenolicus]MDQ0094761.1 DNA-binding transcriptional regulator YhcF (GntR family) [Paeniglutamicibacter psychrophenolicus]